MDEVACPCRTLSHLQLWQGQPLCRDNIEHLGLWGASCQIARRLLHQCISEVVDILHSTHAMRETLDCDPPPMSVDDAAHSSRLLLTSTAMSSDAARLLITPTSARCSIASAAEKSPESAICSRSLIVCRTLASIWSAISPSFAPLAPRTKQSWIAPEPLGRNCAWQRDETTA